MPTIVDSWLEPLADTPCGDNLEYDDDFRAMEKAAAGRPPNQFETEGVAPDWRTVLNQSQMLFERTRDLRVAIHWARARIRLDGAATLPEGLRLASGLLSRFWDTLHPLPDDGDAYARVNALNDMCSQAGLLGDLRESLIVADRSIGELRGRDVEIALGALEPRADESTPGRSQVEQMLREAVAAEPALAAFADAALAQVTELQQLMRDRVGYATAPELQPLVAALSGIRSVMPGEAAAAGAEAGATGADYEAGDSTGAAGTSRRGARAGLGGGIQSRADALHAIDMVCEYLERTEPTNPAQLLLRRARKLVNKNFVQLVRELAPESLDSVARVMGISAEELLAIQTQD